MWILLYDDSFWDNGGEDLAMIWCKEMGNGIFATDCEKTCEILKKMN